MFSSTSKQDWLRTPDHIEYIDIQFYGPMRRSFLFSLGSQDHTFGNSARSSPQLRIRTAGRYLHLKRCPKLFLKASNLLNTLSQIWFRYRHVLLYVALDWGRTDGLIAFFFRRPTWGNFSCLPKCNTKRGNHKFTVQNGWTQTAASGIRSWHAPLHRAHFFELGIDWDRRTLGAERFWRIDGDVSSTLRTLYRWLFYAAEWKLLSVQVKHILDSINGNLLKPD